MYFQLQLFAVEFSVCRDDTAADSGELVWIPEREMFSQQWLQMAEGRAQGIVEDRSCEAQLEGVPHMSFSSCYRMRCSDSLQNGVGICTDVLCRDVCAVFSRTAALNCSCSS